MDFHALFEAVTIGFEVIGVAALMAGFIVSCLLAFQTWNRTHDGGAAFRTLRVTFGGIILLGLEILVAADLVKSVTSHSTVADVAILGLIVLIRTVLAFSLQTEIDGVAPWRRAFVTGPEIIAEAVRSTEEPTAVVSQPADWHGPVTE